MKISTKGRYALRLMLDLALNNSGKPVRIRDVSERQNISDKYLEQIISVLNKARFVRSIRGPQGGYLLTRRPEEYTVGMILRLTEGTLAPVSCLREDQEPCEKSDSCCTLPIWKGLADLIDKYFDEMTLADVLQSKQEAEKKAAKKKQ